MEPFSKIKRSWDFLFLLILFVDIFYTPFKTTFFYKQSQSYFFFNIMIISALFLDLTINLQTAYYLKGEFITDRKKIFKNYLKTNFLLDLIIFIPFFLLDSHKGTWFFFFRIIRFKQVLTKVDEFLQFNQQTQAFIDLGKLIHFNNIFGSYLWMCIF